MNGTFATSGTNCVHFGFALNVLGLQSQRKDVDFPRRLNLDSHSRVSGIKRNTLIPVWHCEKYAMSLASAPWCAYASFAWLSLLADGSATLDILFG